MFNTSKVFAIKDIEAMRLKYVKWVFEYRKLKYLYLSGRRRDKHFGARANECKIGAYFRPKRKYHFGIFKEVVEFPDFRNLHKEMRDKLCVEKGLKRLFWNDILELFPVTTYLETSALFFGRFHQHYSLNISVTVYSLYIDYNNLNSDMIRHHSY